MAELQRFEPEMVSRKSPLAVAQNAFIFRQVQSIARKDDDILLVGGYDDPTGPALSKLGFQVRIIDPKIDGNEARNIWLETLLKTGRLYDIIASCSVMEHVPDDVSFVYHLYALLKPGGIAFLTGPFQEVEEDEEDETEEIIDPDLVPRLYTVNRLDNLVRHVPERALLDAPTWDRCDPDLCRTEPGFCSLAFRKPMIRRPSEVIGEHRLAGLVRSMGEEIEILKNTIRAYQTPPPPSRGQRIKRFLRRPFAKSR